MIIRELNKQNSNDLNEALKLVWQVFSEFEAPYYTKKGIDEFYRSIHDKEYINTLNLYGAFDKENLIGVIAARNSGKHIALFFVKKEYQKQGIGKKLFETIIQHSSSKEITVNSSCFAVPIYHRLGFSDTSEEQITNGIRYTPMKIVLK